MTNKKQDQRMKKRSLNKRSLFGLACFFMSTAVGIIFFTTFFSLQKKIDTMEHSGATLEFERNTQIVTVQKLQRMLEYSKMEEYWAQLAREKLGYVNPGDIKFLLPK